MPTTPTQYLDANILRSIAKIELQAKMLVEGMYASRHRCPYYGSSVEFVDHREYVPGDEPRSIDWKTLARTEKYFVKRFEMESNMNVVCLLDTSGSMGYRSRDQRRLTKLEYAKYLAASLSYLVYKQQDAPGLITFDQELRDFLPARQGQRHLFQILVRLQSLAASNQTEIGELLKTAAQRLKRRGMIVLISDCYDEAAIANLNQTDDESTSGGPDNPEPVDDQAAAPDSLIDGIRHLAIRGHDVVVFQVMDHDEVTFPFQSLSSFRDLETGQRLIGDPLRQRRTYLDRFESFRNHVREGVTGCGADYRFIDTSEPIELVLRDYLLYRRGKG